MKSVYKRTILIITEFNTEDVITTSGPVPEPVDPPVTTIPEKENRYASYETFSVRRPGGWF